MNKYLYVNNQFLPSVAKDGYLKAALWNEASGVFVGEDIYQQYPLALDGRVRVTGPDKMPAWADAPALTPDELIAVAERQRTMLTATANVHMSSQQWPGKAAIGRLKDKELAQYNLWLDYLDALYAVDASAAPDIEWPTAPVA